MPLLPAWRSPWRPWPLRLNRRSASRTRACASWARRRRRPISSTWTRWPVRAWSTLACTRSASATSRCSPGGSTARSGADRDSEGAGHQLPAGPGSSGRLGRVADRERRMAVAGLVDAAQEAAPGVACGHGGAQGPLLGRRAGDLPHHAAERDDRAQHRIAAGIGQVLGLVVLGLRRVVVGAERAVEAADLGGQGLASAEALQVVWPGDRVGQDRRDVGVLQAEILGRLARDPSGRAAALLGGLSGLLAGFLGRVADLLGGRLDLVGDL